MGPHWGSGLSAEIVRFRPSRDRLKVEVVKIKGPGRFSPPPPDSPLTGAVSIFSPAAGFTFCMQGQEHPSEK